LGVLWVTSGVAKCSPTSCL